MLLTGKQIYSELNKVEKKLPVCVGHRKEEPEHKREGFVL